MKYFLCDSQSFVFVISFCECAFPDRSVLHVATFWYFRKEQVYRSSRRFSLKHQIISVYSETGAHAADEAKRLAYVSSCGKKKERPESGAPGKRDYMWCFKGSFKEKRRSDECFPKGWTYGADAFNHHHEWIAEPTDVSRVTVYRRYALWSFLCMAWDKFHVFLAGLSNRK